MSRVLLTFVLAFCISSCYALNIHSNVYQLKEALKAKVIALPEFTYKPYDTLPPVFEMKVLIQGASCEILSYAPTQPHHMLREDDASHVIIHSSLAIREEDHAHDDELQGTNETMLVRFYSRSYEAITAAVKSKCEHTFQATELAEENVGADEIVALVKSGDPKNRIDVVLMGDGYTEAQRALFFDDMKRMVGDMFQDVTFASYLPVFNIWALFRASVQSGIGIGGTPRNTAFGLYRDGTELRGIYCSKTSAARQACAGVGQYACDFPSLIANDAFYGGLGGEFTIGTSSHTTGTIVLRHEMGHNFGSVGEEYDGGSVYSGANSATTLTQVSTKWGSWLTQPDIPVVQQQSIQRLQSYAWYDLARGPLRLTFTSDGQWNRAYFIFSVSGCETANSLRVTIDGVLVNWQTTGVLDRQFYPFIFNAGFSAGTHVIQFEGTAPTTNQIRQVCNANLHEYKAENLFKFDNSYVGAYPTWSSSQRLTYRPTNERCLMRNMTSPRFCPVCQENNWLQFFSRMSLIDQVTVTRPTGTTVAVALTVVPLAQFRAVPVPGERYLVKWTRNGVVDNSLANMFSFTRATNLATGTWNVEVQFQTLEVRSDPSKRLTATTTFTV